MHKVSLFSNSLQVKKITVAIFSYAEKLNNLIKKLDVGMIIYTGFFLMKRVSDHIQSNKHKLIIFFL